MPVRSVGWLSVWALASACEMFDPAATVGEAVQGLASCSAVGDCPLDAGVAACLTPSCESHACGFQPKESCCDPGSESTDCDDHNSCTADVCADGGCVNVPPPDGGGGCCAQESDCQLSVGVCQAVHCIAGQCVTQSSQGAGCCNGTSECDGGARCGANQCTCGAGNTWCTAQNRCIPAAECCSAQDCVGNACQDGACTAGVCVFAPKPQAGCCAAPADCELPGDPCLARTCVANTCGAAPINSCVSDGGADLRAPPDLSAIPDLAPPPDFSVPPDLAPAPDLAVPDLAFVDQAAPGQPDLAPSLSVTGGGCTVGGAPQVRGAWLLLAALLLAFGRRRR